MHFFTTAISSALIFTVALAGPITARADDNQKRICPNLKVSDNGCIRYVRGFDVTGVVTEVDLTFPLIQSACDCIQECLNRPTTVPLMSTNVTIGVDVNSPLNKNINGAETLALGNNPQQGALVPQAFKDIIIPFRIMMLCLERSGSSPMAKQFARGCNGRSW
ncbi:hypothetical protein AOQ84DRAFT_376303 [Glonium stellatum]|uniref:Uncharacterized protein n=1 Tax=Glonium stellatum TaxID=574774 RepID=A0A8E2F273_9PEZI|nr:hypothetical protein AOQ84DRAFT_376303 [Glonium stellatum]